MAVTPEMISAVRMEVADTDPAIPLMSDAEITYFLQKKNENITKASLDVARVILFKLSQQGDETVSVFSLKGSKAAEQYRLALELYLKNPHLNPVLDGLGSYTDENGKVQNPIYAGGISNSDMLANTSNPDNNYVPNPIYQKGEENPFNGPWSI